MLESQSVKSKISSHVVNGVYLYCKVGYRCLKIPHIHERKLVLKEIHDGHGHYGQNLSHSSTKQNHSIYMLR